MDVKELGLIRTMSKKAKRKTSPMQSYRWLKNGTLQEGGIWGQLRNHFNFQWFLLPLTVTDSRAAVGALSPAARCVSPAAVEQHSSEQRLPLFCRLGNTAITNLVDWGL